MRAGVTRYWHRVIADWSALVDRCRDLGRVGHPWLASFALAMTVTVPLIVLLAGIVLVGWLVATYT